MAEQIGRRIRALREQGGLTQEALAEQCGVYGANVVSRWESGKQTPSLDVAARIADVLGVSVDALVRADAAEGKRKRRPLEDQSARLLRGLNDRELEAVAALLRKLAQGRGKPKAVRTARRKKPGRT